MKGFRLDKSFSGAIFAGLITAGASLPLVIADQSISKGEVWTLGVAFAGAFFGWLKTHPPAFITDEAVDAAQVVADKAQGAADQIAKEQTVQEPAKK